MSTSRQSWTRSTTNGLCPSAPGCVGLYRPDGIINSADLRPFHDPAPKWILGLSSYMTYGRFDFNVTLRACLGNYVYNNVASTLGATDELTKRASPNNLQSSVLETGFAKPQYWSDYYVEDGSFLRLDQLALGYTFNWHSQPVRLFLIG